MLGRPRCKPFNQRPRRYEKTTGIIASVAGTRLPGAGMASNSHQDMKRRTDESIFHDRSPAGEEELKRRCRLTVEQWAHSLGIVKGHSVLEEIAVNAAVYVLRRLDLPRPWKNPNGLPNLIRAILKEKEREEMLLRRFAVKVAQQSVFLQMKSMTEEDLPGYALRCLDEMAATIVAAGKAGSGNEHRAQQSIVESPEWLDLKRATLYSDDDLIAMLQKAISKLKQP